MPAPELQSVVNVQTYANGQAAISVTGKGGTLTFDVFTDGPTIGIEDPARGANRVKAGIGIKANGHLRGFFVEKKGATGADDTVVWFPAKKKRARKRAPKKRNTKT